MEDLDVKTNQELITEFLEQKTIVVAGISKSNKPGNAIYKKFRSAGYHVVGVHPIMTEFEGDVCYKSVLDIPFVPDGVFMVTSPEVSHKITQDCIKHGVKRIWMHNMTGVDPQWGKVFAEKNGSVEHDAVEMAKNAGITVIAGSCPMHYLPPVDLFHKCIHWMNVRTNSL